MPDQPYGFEPKPLPPNTAPAGIRWDCHTCSHWTGGSIVCRGSTIGWCDAFTMNTSADFGCDVHTHRAPAVQS